MAAIFSSSKIQEALEIEWSPKALNKRDNSHRLQPSCKPALSFRLPTKSHINKSDHNSAKPTAENTTLVTRNCTRQQPIGAAGGVNQSDDVIGFTRHQ